MDACTIFIERNEKKKVKMYVENIFIQRKDDDDNRVKMKMKTMADLGLADKSIWHSNGIAYDIFICRQSQYNKWI